MDDTAADRARPVRMPLVALVMAATLVACGGGSEPPPSPFTSIDVSSVPWGRGGFHLTDHTGRPRSLAGFKGKVVMLFFGYTHCPDLCPTTLAKMAQVRAKLGYRGSRVQGLFVTVDPRRDTPQALARFVPAFDATFLGLYGDDNATAAVTKEFKVFYGTQPASDLVDHSGGVYVFDTQGRLRLMVRPGTSVDAMAADIVRLLKE